MRITAYAVLIATIVSFATTSYADIEYLTQLRRVTHRGQAYDANTWDADVIWFATFFDDAFRRAYAKQHAKIEHLGPLESAQWVADQERIQNEEWDLFISMYTRKDYKKFSLDPDTFWQIYITTASGEVVRPIAVEQIAITPYERVMFNHINRWSKGYKVVFPKAELGDNIRITLQSIVGQSYLTWTNPR